MHALDDNQALLVCTKWKVVGFMESEVVRWSGYQKLSNDEMGKIMYDEDFVFKEL